MSGLESNPVLELRGVTKRFGGITACRDITFNVARGQIMGLIGPNGAGKTTAFNLITGVYGLTEGAVVLEGQTISGKRPDLIVRQGIARTFQNIRLFRNLSVLDNVIIALDCHETYLLGASFLRLPSVRRRERAIREQAMVFLAAVGLEDKAATRADAMPYGLQRKLEIARALALKPRLLLLDEPSLGLAPLMVQHMFEIIREIRQKGVTILLAEQNAFQALDMADQAFVLETGKVIVSGTGHALLDDPLVQKAYLGVTH